MSFPNGEHVTDEGMPEVCFLGKGQKRLCRFIVLQFVRKIRSIREQELTGDVGKQILGIRQADGPKHGTDFLFACRDVMPLRFPRKFSRVVGQAWTISVFHEF